MKLKLRKVGTGKSSGRRFDCSKLQKPEIQRTFALKLTNRFNAHNNEAEMTIDEFNCALRETSKEILGYQKKRREEWISETTWTKIARRRETKERMWSTTSQCLKERFAAQYAEKDKEVKRSCRKDKRQYFEKLAFKAEETAKSNDMRTLYKTTKSMKGSHGNNHDIAVKAKDGKTIKNERERTDGWREHFEAILNRPIPQENPEICESEEDLDISTEPPTVKEVYQAIKKMKSGKTPGEDEITAEMLKGRGKEICNVLCQIFSNIWENEEAPEEWKSGLIVKLPKRGDLTTCDNWRGVTLLSLTSKVFSRILLDRFLTTVEDISRNEQAGFRKGSSCIDHIFVLRQILEQAAEWNRTEQGYSMDTYLIT